MYVCERMEGEGKDSLVRRGPAQVLYFTVKLLANSDLFIG